MHADTGKTPDLRHMLAAELPDLHVHEVRFLDEGWDNRLYLVDEDLIVRVAKFEAESKQLLDEANTLASIGPLLPLPVPYPQFVHHPSADFPAAAMGYRRLPGRSLDAKEITGAVAAMLAPDLARFLIILHSIPADAFRRLPAHVFTPVDWMDRHVRLVRDTFADLRQLLDVATLNRFLDWWNGYQQDAVALDFEPCFIHGDLGCEHLLVERDPWRITGVIDFGDAMVADPALDLAGFPDNLARSVLHLMPDIGELQPFWRRRDAYRKIAPLHAVRAGRDHNDRLLLEEGIDGLRKRF